MNHRQLLISYLATGRRTPVIIASDATPHSSSQNKVGLVLSGGGARGAYQAGVLKAIGEIAEKNGLNNPFPIMTGVSAGAISASFLASRANHFRQGTDDLCELWSTITAENVFRTDALTAGRSGLRFLSDVLIGGLYQKKFARSLLDTSPLAEFLHKKIDFEGIRNNLNQGHLQAFALTAMNYTDSSSIAFLQESTLYSPMMWERSRRKSEVATLGVEHVMASAAIPLFFPAVRVGNHHFGDGCLRNTAPLSPAIHLGANRLMVISARKPDVPGAHTPVSEISPSVARVLGVVLNAVLLDAIDVDMERMSRINQTLRNVSEEKRASMALKNVDYLWIRPSEDIGKLAGELFDRLPKVIRYLVSGLGSSKEASELTSYLLFDPDFCGKLVKIGYEDGLSHTRDILQFIRD